MYDVSRALQSKVIWKDLMKVLSHIVNLGVSRCALDEHLVDLTEDRVALLYFFLGQNSKR